MSATDVIAPPAATATRVLRAPLWAHVLALALVLLALVPLLGRAGQFSADEGAAMAQARLLSDGRGWSLDHPLADLDPANEAFPLEKSNPVDRPGGEPASAPFAKHPSYAVLLAFADGWGGPTGMVLTSVLGTLLAALLAAKLTSRLSPGLGPAALWVTGLATPLFVDSWVVIAHTLGAALVAGAALSVLRVHRREAGAPLLAVVAAMAGAVLLRNEAVLMGAALLLATGWLAWHTRRWLTAAAAVAVLAGTVIGHELDGWLSSGVTGGIGAEGAAGVGQPGYVVGRLTSAFITLFLPSYGSLGPGDLVTVLAVASLLAAVVIARRRPEDRSGIALFAGLATVGAVARALMEPQVTPGLLVAAPLVTAGLAALGGTVGRDPERRWLAATVALFAAAVLATQYASGGSGEWGGRYFAIGLTLIVPLVVIGLRDALAGVGHSTRRLLAGAMVVSSLAFAVAGGRAVVTTEEATDEFVIRVEAARAQRDDPVVVATAGAAARFAWRQVLTGEDWLYVESAALPIWLERLAEADRDVVLATRDPVQDRESLAGWTVLSDERVTRGSSWTVITLQEG